MTHTAYTYNIFIAISAVQLSVQLSVQFIIIKWRTDLAWCCKACFSQIVHIVPLSWLDCSFTKEKMSVSVDIVTLQRLLGLWYRRRAIRRSISIVSTLDHHQVNPNRRTSVPCRTRLSSPMLYTVHISSAVVTPRTKNLSKPPF